MSESTEQTTPPTVTALPQNAPKCPIEEGEGNTDADGLSSRQRGAIELLAAGKTASQVATQVGVNRKTLYRWRHEDANFVAELDARRREIWSATADRLRALLPKAVDTLAKELGRQSVWDNRPFLAAVALLRLPLVTRAVLLNPADVDGKAAGS
jgi:hypothetical protein